MNDQTIIRDERTKSIGNEGDHLGFTILLFGVLVDVFFFGAPYLMKVRGIYLHWLSSAVGRL